jgi:hypothetical protein
MPEQVDEFVTAVTEDDVAAVEAGVFGKGGA